ncbi:MAG TPA: hypothetical protein VGQ03_07155 [Nitrososphaera sp.]|jgi:hypothetical protein|nr:hypothetical protein [Nitrososphaera sp.]
MNRILIDIIVAGVIAAVVVIAIAASAYKSGPQPMWSLNKDPF